MAALLGADHRHESARPNRCGCNRTSKEPLDTRRTEEGKPYYDGRVPWVTEDCQTGVGSRGVMAKWLGSSPAAAMAFRAACSRIKTYGRLGPPLLKVVGSCLCRCF